MADARDGPSVAARLKLCAQATGEAVAPQDEAMIRILSQLAVAVSYTHLTLPTKRIV